MLLLVLLRRRVVGLLVPVLLLLLLLLSKTASSSAVSISRTVCIMHLHVVGHLVMRGRGHWRGVAPARDCVLFVERRRGNDESVRETNKVFCDAFFHARLSSTEQKRHQPGCPPG